MFVQTLFVYLVCASTSYAKNLNSRSVFRSGETGTVNLVEFNIKGTVYGRCSFKYDGDDVTSIYEEKGNELIAKTTNPTVVDPISKARLCRELATRVPADAPQSRSDFGEVIPETELEMIQRLKDFETRIYENQEYVDHLKPRLFGVLNNIFNNNGVEFTIGGNKNFLNGIGFSTGNKNNVVDASFGISANNKFPFFLLGKKKR